MAGPVQPGRNSSSSTGMQALDAHSKTATAAGVADLSARMQVLGMAKQATIGEQQQRGLPARRASASCVETGC